MGHYCVSTLDITKPTLCSSYAVTQSYWTASDSCAIRIFYADPRLDFGYGQLHKAVVCRSVDQVRQSFHSKECLTGGLNNGTLSLLELAVGWPRGLQKLLEAGFKLDAIDALRQSVYMEDLSSTKILLAAEVFPGDSKYGWTQVLSDLATSGNQEIRQIVVQTLRERRQALSELAIEKVPGYELFGLGLLDEGILDVMALKVYQRLRERGINVPLSLNPASSSDLGGHSSVYLY